MDYLWQLWSDVSQAASGEVMKFGMDELTSAVRLNDVYTDALQQGLPEIAESMDVDINALQHVASQRALMVVELLRREGLMGDSPVRQMNTQAAIASAWVDGFFAAMNAVEQQSDS